MRLALPLLLVTLGLLALAAGPAPNTAPNPVQSADAASPAATSAVSYGIDGVHSSVIFAIQHKGLAWFQGRFNGVSGTIVVDDEEPTNSTVTIEIAADSVDTASEKRDQHIQSADFLNAKEFPAITYEGKVTKVLSENRFVVEGELSLHGVSKTLSIEVERTGTGESRGRKLVGFGASVSFQRSDFGMDYMLEGLSDEVRLTFGLEAVGG